MDIAWTAVIADKPDAEGRHWTLGLATRHEAGYSPIKESDPTTFYVAKGPTRFRTMAEADAEAVRKNKIELNLSELEAFEIVASSIGAQRGIGRNGRRA